jgi:capsule polysaccharide export protein KpsC/LpsZ
MKVQDGNGTHVAPSSKYPPDLYRSYNKGIIKWWTYLGPTTNRSLLIVAAAFSLPQIFCWIVVIPANLYLVGMKVWQRNVTRQLETAHAGSPSTGHPAR